MIYNMTGSAARHGVDPRRTDTDGGRSSRSGAQRRFRLCDGRCQPYVRAEPRDLLRLVRRKFGRRDGQARIDFAERVGGHAIAGEAVFAEGALGACEGSSSVTLNFGGEGVALPTQHSDTEVFAAMVLYPADLSEATVSVVYTFADGFGLHASRLPAGDSRRAARCAYRLRSLPPTASATASST